MRNYNFNPFVRFIILGASILFLSMASANAATIWTNGEQNGAGAWDLNETIADDFWSNGAAIGYVDLWLVSKPTDLGSVLGGLDITFTKYTDTIPYVPATPSNQVSASIDSYSSILLGTGLSWDGTGDLTLDTSWTNVSSYKVTLNLAPAASLVAGLWSMSVGFSTNDGIAGWMWSSIADADASAAGYTLSPLLNASDGNDIPPEALAFKIRDTYGNGMGKLSPVPVPAAIWLFGTALIGFVGMSRKTKVS